MGLYMPLVSKSPRLFCGVPEIRVKPKAVRHSVKHNNIEVFFKYQNTIHINSLRYYANMPGVCACVGTRVRLITDTTAATVASLRGLSRAYVVV